MDEPSTGLDTVSRSDLWSVIKRAKKDCTIILTSNGFFCCCTLWLDQTSCFFSVLVTNIAFHQLTPWRRLRSCATGSASSSTASSIVLGLPRR
jgi:ABC-type Mn2+/Zn2+ transport system ATPase subunit